MPGYHVDASGLDRLARDFKAAAPAVRREYRKGLRDAGKLVAVNARERIEPYSPPTAASIKVGVRGVNKVVIRAGGRRIATLLEGDGRSGEWRHPLFGDREHWYAQQRHPYMHPAGVAEKDRVAARISRCVRDGLRDADIESSGR